MSKYFRSFLLIFAAFLQILQFFTNSDAQDVEATIKIDANSPSVARVEGRFVKERASKNLSFILDYAGITGLGERVSNVRLLGGDKKPVAFRRMIAGEYLADDDFRSWSYAVNLLPVAKQSAAAHLSWLGKDGGVIMLDDLLPQLGKGKPSLKLTFDLPPGWKILVAERRVAPASFEIDNVEKAVFYIGSDRREKDLSSGNIRLKLNISGDWLFSDEEAAAIAASIFKEYERVFGPAPATDFRIGISKFQIPVSVGNWEADTRGRSITLVSSDMPFKSQSVQRLHEQLRHEIFHLWIPNGVNLNGNYDWFYEGFALYQSLKLGVAVNQIRFDDFLDTLSRAYDIDKMQSQKLSLIEASKNRWKGANAQIYASGMLVAFLCDLALLDKSKGKRSVTDLLRVLYERHRAPNAAQDGNTAILTLLRSHSELVPVIDRNITGSESIDWTVLLKAAGLEAVVKDQMTNLKVTAKPTSRQKDLLDKLGYNSWRKLTSRQ